MTDLLCKEVLYKKDRGKLVDYVRCWMLKVEWGISFLPTEFMPRLTEQAVRLFACQV